LIPGQEAIQKKKGISKDRVNAYVASVESKQGLEEEKRQRHLCESQRNSSDQQKLRIVMAI
jgi:hypothetical protein